MLAPQPRCMAAPCTSRVLATLMRATSVLLLFVSAVFVGQRTLFGLPQCMLRPSCWCAEQCGWACKLSIQMKQPQLMLRQS